MSIAQANARAVLWSLLLHVGILLSLALMALPCGRFEAAFARLGLPAWLNPVECRKPAALPGPVIQATLVGPVAAPRPKAQAAPKPPPPPPKPPVRAEKPPVKTLPPPPDKPAPRDQQRVVKQAAVKAEQAQREQEARQRQRQAELEADRLLAQLDQLKKQTAAVQQRSEQSENKLQAAEEAPPVATDVPEAEQARSGAGGAQADLLASYAAALTRTITDSWLRPDNIPVGSVCPLRITQIPGGQVISVEVLPSCPFDDAGRRSVKNAVLRAQPLPYRGFQSVFQRTVTLNFQVME